MAGAASPRDGLASPSASAEIVAGFNAYTSTLPAASTRGVALVFGWVGSTPRLLRRYAELLMALGIRRVYTMTAPTLALFFGPRTMRAIAHTALDLLQRAHGGEPALLFYLSNGGCYVHEQLLPLLREDAEKPAGARAWPDVRIAATAFDSTPTWLSLHSGSLAMSEGAKSVPAQWAIYIITWLVMMLVYVPCMVGSDRPRVCVACAGGAAVWVIAAPSQGHRSHPLRAHPPSPRHPFPRPSCSYFASMAADHLPCPSLYLYSTSDHITDVVKLDELVEERRERHAGGPARIRTLRFTEPSPHVGHLLKHPARYREAVADLLAEAGMGSAGGGKAKM
jgi:hypothetical protein